jgi:hypothetical protein
MNTDKKDFSFLEKPNWTRTSADVRGKRKEISVSIRVYPRSPRPIFAVWAGAEFEENR